MLCCCYFLVVFEICNFRIFEILFSIVSIFKGSTAAKTIPSTSFSIDDNFEGKLIEEIHRQFRQKFSPRPIFSKSISKHMHIQPFSGKDTQKK